MAKRKAAKAIPVAVMIAACEAGLPAPEPEYVFARPRLWRVDFAWPAQLIAVECEGGVWTGGRHTRGSGFMRDMEKYNELALRGWHLLRLTPQQLGSGELIHLLVRAAAAFGT